MIKKDEKGSSELEGLEILRSTLQIERRNDTLPDITNYSVQWYLLHPSRDKEKLFQVQNQDWLFSSSMMNHTDLPLVLNYSGTCQLYA
jgi:Ig domain of plant-specific actin-binding protein